MNENLVDELRSTIEKVKLDIIKKHEEIDSLIKKYQELDTTILDDMDDLMSE